MNRPLGNPHPWPAPGKLNLFLHVVGRRADGYHELQTAFQFIDLSDSLRFFERPAGVVDRLDAVSGVAADDDLVVRAARLLAAAAGRPVPGVAIGLEKRLPVGGGVGGGSSDAATVLVALNELWNLGLPAATLAGLGLTLGADVPVFVFGHAAWAEGVGEQLQPVDFPESDYVLVRPQVAVSTAEVFKAPELTRDSAITTITGFLQAGGRNDFEPVVRRRYPEVAAALDWLAQYGTARLTGTGSSVFAAMPDAARARDVLARLPREWQGWVTVGRNRSPLLERLAHERTFDGMEAGGGADRHAGRTG
ncbi:MAG TPA: 4-(cytidine 5'-diphospho)-2-C-methyl-D-erythritol kinase [Steroidobacteraceae bacterium]|jgi:4-diphosphocytidyl-2-C-methyl-D-erythritol kinase|nr:4-(cytidine 5'-diphospho)-2-C-methyl-D-erythritol kinase [Steroidobacteraceae bacterium]